MDAAKSGKITKVCLAGLSRLSRRLLLGVGARADSAEADRAGGLVPGRERVDGSVAHFVAALAAGTELTQLFNDGAALDTFADAAALSLLVAVLASMLANGPAADRLPVLAWLRDPDRDFLIGCEYSVAASQVMFAQYLGPGGVPMLDSVLEVASIPPRRRS